MLLKTSLLAITIFAVKAGAYGQLSHEGERNKTETNTETSNYSDKSEPPPHGKFQQIYTTTIVRPAAFSYISANVPYRRTTEQKTSFLMEKTVEIGNDSVSKPGPSADLEEPEDSQKSFSTGKDVIAFEKRKAVLPGNDLYLNSKDFALLREDNATVRDPSFRIVVPEEELPKSAPHHNRDYAYATEPVLTPPMRTQAPSPPLKIQEKIIGLKPPLPPKNIPARAPHRTVLTETTISQYYNRSPQVFAKSSQLEDGNYYQRSFQMQQGHGTKPFIVKSPHGTVKTSQMPTVQWQVTQQQKSVEPPIKNNQKYSDHDLKQDPEKQENKKHEKLKLPPRKHFDDHPKFDPKLKGEPLNTLQAKNAKEEIQKNERIKHEEETQQDDEVEDEEVNDEENDEEVEDEDESETSDGSEVTKGPAAEEDSNGEENLDSDSTQENKVVSKSENDQTESASGHKDGGHKESGGGSQHEEHHTGKKGHKGEKGYKKDSKHEKASKGHHDKEAHAGKYHEEKGQEESHEKGEKYYGEHEKEEKGKKGKKYGGDKRHKKGHSTHGEHNIVKKDEYIKTTKFYDEDHDGGEEAEHGEYTGRHAQKKGGKKSGGHHHEKNHKEDFGKKGHSDKGHADEEYTGFKKAEGHDGHFGKEEEYSQKKGGKTHKKWKNR